jgi:hypothetical protein
MHLMQLHLMHKVNTDFFAVVLYRAPGQDIDFAALRIAGAAIDQIH